MHQVSQIIYRINRPVWFGHLLKRMNLFLLSLIPLYSLLAWEQVICHEPGIHLCLARNQVGPSHHESKVRPHHLGSLGWILRPRGGSRRIRISAGINRWQDHLRINRIDLDIPIYQCRARGQIQDHLTPKLRSRSSRIELKLPEGRSLDYGPPKSIRCRISPSETILHHSSTIQSEYLVLLSFMIRLYPSVPL